MKHFAKRSMLGAVLLACSVWSVNAQSEGEVKVFISDYQSRVLGLSDNGRFAVGSAVEDSRAVYPFIWNIEDNTQIYLRQSPDSEELCKYGDAKDVTDDGKIIVGEFDNLPALYYVETGEWKTLPLPSDEYVTGWGQKITPDGVYVIGIALKQGGQTGAPCLWKNGELVDITLPDTDLYGGKVTLACFDDITSDGATLVGRLSYNAFPFASSGFIYDVATQEFSFIAEDVMKTLDPGDNMLDNHLEDMVITPNGKKIAGIFYESVYTGDPDEYDFWAVSEYYTSFEYDVASETFKSYGEMLQEVPVFAVDNNGVMYGATPLNFPIRSAMVIENGEKIALEDYVAEKFNIQDLLGQTGFENTGTITGVSADGNVIVSMATMGGYNYAVVGNKGTGIQHSDVSAGLDAYAVDGVLKLKGEVAVLKVVDMLGRTVLEQNNPGSSVELCGNEGVYLVQLFDVSGHSVVKKIAVR